MNFEDLEREIYAFIAATGIFVKGDQKLERMKNLMRFLGDPQNRLKVVHIAGTSGKTSTSYFAASFLKHAGQKVGLTISPHVTDVRERAQIGLSVLNKETYMAELAEYFELLRTGGQKPSYMEFFMGFFYWLADRMKLDYAVVETGLGGLYDASNVVNRHDKICIIADIGYDHVEILGKTLPEITSQKAGIIQFGNEVFMHDQSPEIMDVLIKTADDERAPLHIVPETKLDDLPDFQSRNASLALEAVKFALERDEKEPLTKTQINEALKVHVPARAEEFSYKGKRVIIDAAHNPQKITAFTEYIVKKYPDRDIALVASLGSNKSAGVDEDMEILRKISSSIILTTFKDTSVETYFRESLPIKILSESAKKNGFQEIQVVQKPIDALDEAVKSSSDLVVVTGSIFLFNDIRPFLMKNQK